MSRAAILVIAIAIFLLVVPKTHTNPNFSLSYQGQDPDTKQYVFEPLLATYIGLSPSGKEAVPPLSLSKGDILQCSPSTQEIEIIIRDSNNGATERKVRARFLSCTGGREYMITGVYFDTWK